MKKNTTPKCRPPLYALVILLFATAASLAPGPAAAQTYIGIDLYTLSPPLPASTSFSAGGASGGQVVGTSGNIAMTGAQHAILWTGPAGNPVDLTPNATGSSGASATDGMKTQVRHFDSNEEQLPLARWLGWKLDGEFPFRLLDSS